MNEMITSFTGEYRFLSNFWRSQITIGAFTYQTLEAAYQASKTEDFDSQLLIAKCYNPAIAKQLGEEVELRGGWEEMKLAVMKELLLIKFNEPILKKALLATGEKHLVEGNYWRDTYWGVCNDVGENHLGRLLMEVREEIK